MITFAVFAAPRCIQVSFIPSSSLKSLVACTIDNLEFVRTGRTLNGQIAIVDFPRLAESLAERSGRVMVQLQGERDVDGHFWLDLGVTGQVKLACQRCLEAIPLDLDIAMRFEVLAPGMPWPEEELEDDSIEVMEANPSLRVDEWVEDEIILALPLAPMHVNCALPGAAHAGQELSPFAVLAGLKKH